MGNLLIETLVRGVYALAGLDSPYSNQEYGPNWSKQRRRCLDRDNHQCRVCNTDEEELKNSLAVHHITPRRDFDGNLKQNNLKNLISLCPSCHGKFEGRYTDAGPDEFERRARAND